MKIYVDHQEYSVTEYVLRCLVTLRFLYIFILLDTYMRRVHSN